MGPGAIPPNGQAAFDRFLALAPASLASVAPHVFAYYLDMLEHLGGQEWPGVPIPKIVQPGELWPHVRPVAVFIGSDWDDEGPWYVGVEANIPWEVEHGLVMVWENGDQIVKVGQVDGHFTNANSYADPELKGVVYHARNSAHTSYQS